MTCIEMISLSHHYQILTEGGGDHKTSGKNYLNNKGGHTIPKKNHRGKGKKKYKKSKGVSEVTKQGFIKKNYFIKRQKQCSIKNNNLFPGYYKKRYGYVEILQQ